MFQTLSELSQWAALLHTVNYYDHQKVAYHTSNTWGIKSSAGLKCRPTAGGCFPNVTQISNFCEAVMWCSLLLTEEELFSVEELTARHWLETGRTCKSCWSSWICLFLYFSVSSAALSCSSSFSFSWNSGPKTKTVKITLWSVTAALLMSPEEEKKPVNHRTSCCWSLMRVLLLRFPLVQSTCSYVPDSFALLSDLRKAELLLLNSWTVFSRARFSSSILQILASRPSPFLLSSSFSCAAWWRAHSSDWMCRCALQEQI